MKLVKQTAEYSIFQRNDKRYAVKGLNKAWINGDDKVAILLKEGLVKAPEPKAKEPEPVEVEETPVAEGSKKPAEEKTD